MARVNYQREKRLKDLDRQRKQEEKRARKLHKDTAPEDPGTNPGLAGEQDAAEGLDAVPAPGATAE